MLGYFCASLDRSNVGMAATTMASALHFSNAQFGFGAGIFFVGYLIAEVPSNLVLARFGARRWISRMLMIWGIFSGMTAFVWNDWGFYTMRFVLGLAEAGYFPGVLIFISWWYPARYRGRATAYFMGAGVCASIFGAPIGGLLLQMENVLGLDGWQWLFILESLPAILTGVLVLGLLTDHPAEATWLPLESRRWLAERLAAERAQQEAVKRYTLWEALRGTKVWLLTFVEFGHQYAGYSLGFFMPLIVKGLGVERAWIGPVVAAPYIFGLVASIAWGRSSDRSGERIWHSVGTMFLVGAAVVACYFIGAGHPVLLMAALCVAVAANQSFAPCFWSIPGTLLTGTAAAGGVAMINAIGNLGGSVGPWLFGAARDATGSTGFALLCLAVGPVIAGVVLLLVGHDRRLEQVPPMPRTR
ncbi:MFS transporter [Telmatospirillum sp.]|uniref:MFS transporter n=1 Tax=Telmatospirillum sp. TaxID=2079197 RepID=UPI002851AA31|nr:MFS transporter [Telmatospirillum sp.]MDR3435301.1 MFS transporter [Telmatospirillum sp.]